MRDLAIFDFFDRLFDLLDPDLKPLRRLDRLERAGRLVRDPLEPALPDGLPYPLMRPLVLLLSALEDLLAEVDVPEVPVVVVPEGDWLVV